MSNEKYHAAIDIGTTKVCTLVGVSNASGDVQIIGVGTVPSQGMQKGMVSNISELQQAILTSVREAEAQSGVKISSAYVGITGSHIKYINSRASVENRDYRTPVGTKDLAMVKESCFSGQESDGTRVLHVIPRNYSIDGNWGVKNPMGMYASSVEVESHIITADSSSVDNLIEVLQKSGVRCKGMVIEPLASAEAVLSQDERSVGVVLVDIGGGTSDVSIFLDGSIWHTNVIPVGGFQVTRDISIAFTTFSLAAEEAKLNYGHAIPKSIDAREQITLPGFANEQFSQISRQELCAVINDRVDELLNMILTEVDKAGLKNVPAGGLVLTGGSSKLPGLREMASDIWPGPVRIGMPAASSWVPHGLEDPAFATVLGLIFWDARHSYVAGNTYAGSGIAKYSFMLKHWLSNLTNKVHA